MKALLTSLCLVLFIGLSAQEICDNGIDDDFDGLIDMNDSLECSCTQSAGGSGSIPSIIPNPSFESYSCCPSSWSQLNCADTWIQATSATSDYFNSCGHIHTDAPLPTPDGNGYVGTIVYPGWVEYVGTCLLSPMLAGQSYTLEFDIAAGTENGYNQACGPGIWFSDIDVTIFGTDNCANLPVSTTGCPVSGSAWSAIASATYTPVNSWGTITFTFTPTIDIYGIIIGAPCTLPPDWNMSGGCYPIMFFDDLTLNESSMFGASVDMAGGFCTNDLELTGHPDTITGQYQWYVDGVALVGETDTILDVSGGSYPPGLYTFVTDIPGVGCVYANIDLPPVTYPDIDIVDPGPQCDPGPFDLNTLVVNDNNSVPGTTITYHSSPPSNATDMTNQLGSLNMMSTDVVYVMMADPVTGCFDVEQVILTWVTVSVTEASTDETCAGDNDGTITITGSGGTSPYTYDIGFGPTNTTGLFTNLPPNTYNYTVTDVNGCQATGTIIIVTGPSCCPMSNTVSFTDPLCVGSCDGTITLTESGGTPTVTFSIDNGATTNTTGLFTGLCAGTYNIVITDGTGCQFIDVVVLTDPTPIGGSAVVVDETCLGDCLGSITLTGNSGLSPYTYSFDNGATYGAINNQTNLCAGNYDVGVMDANGCIFVWTETVNAGAANLDPTINAAGPFCVNDIAVMMTAATTGGTWSGTGITDPVNGIFDPSVAGAGSWDIIYNSAAPCSDADTITVVVNPLPTISFTGDNLQGCVAHTVTFTNTGTTGICLWDFGDGGTSTNCNPTYTYNTAGTYDVTLTVTDANGCINSYTETNYIDVFAIPVANFSFSPQPTTFLDAEIFFTDLSTNAAQWNWDFAGLGSSLAQNPTFEFDSIGNYNVTLIVTSANGCSDTVMYTVVINDEFLIYVPNAITLNGDGINDVFYPVLSGAVDGENYTLYIFNRWGELLFESNNPSIGWDGSYKGVTVQEDVYVWKILAKDDQKNSYEYIGHVTVLK